MPNFEDFIIGFFERRIRRLIPALIPFTLITGLLVCFFNPFPLISLNTGITSLFGLSNLYLLKESTDYFASSTQLNAFTHTWSLDVEEQFYFVFPFIIWFTGFSQNKKNGYSNLFKLIISLILLSLLGYIYLYSINPNAAYFLMPTRFWEMAAGCFTFLLLKKKFFHKNLSRINDKFIFLLIIIVLLLPEAFTMPATILVVLFTSLLICSLDNRSKLFKLFVNSNVLHFGELSYSLYLWHWTILCISRLTIGIHLWTVPFQLMLIYFFALASYKYVEKPFRQSKWSIKRTITIFKGILYLIFSGLFLFFLRGEINEKIYLGNYKEKEDIINNWRNDISSATKEINGKKCHAEKSYLEADILSIFDNCKIINPKNKTKRLVAFVGDSHSLAMMSSQKIIYEKGNSILNYSFNGCPFPYPLNGLIPKKCSNFLRISTEKVLKDLNKGDFVVINNYHLSHLGDKSLRDVRHNLFDDKGNLPNTGTIKLQIYINSLIEFTKKAKEREINVILIGAGMRNNLVKISSKEWFRPFPPNYVFEEERKNAKELNNEFKKKLLDLDNFSFIDPLEEFSCCKDISDYNIYYRDSDHLSEYGSNLLMKKVEIIISKN